MKVFLHYLQVLVGLCVIGFARGLQAAGFNTHVAVFARTAVGDLWTPTVWIPGALEASTKTNNIINSGIVARGPEFDEIATGGGVQGNMPFIKEPDYADQPQAAGVEPPINGLASGNQICPILNRESAIGSEALASAVSGVDVVGATLGVIGGVRVRQRQTTLLNVVRGVFGNAAAPGAGAAAFKPLRNDIFTETGAGAIAANLFSSGAFIDTTSVFGEVKEKLLRGAILCHSTIEAAMLKQNDIQFIKNSAGEIVLRLYKGIPLFLSDLLVRNGTVSGKVYDTYIFVPRALGMGEKAQSSKVGDVASLTMKEDAAANNVAFYDRTRFVLHPAGARWTGAPAGQSASNAELATEGNWALAFADSKNCGICCLRTNG